MTYQFGFVMDQIAGHITTYKNLRAVASQHADIAADWHEIAYYREGGAIERLRKTLPFIPGYATGIARATHEMRRAVRSRPYDALYNNASVFVFFSKTYRRIPTLIDFDSTPMQLDRMEAYGAQPDPAPVAKLKWNLTRSAYQSAALLQVWSRWVKTSLIDDYQIDAEKIVINPPGIDLSLWHPGPPRSSRTGEPLRVLFVGGDFVRKGGPLLLDWYAAQNPGHVELHVVTREDVAARPGLYIYHDIEPNSPQLIQLYHQADLFVLPSLGECFGIATVEAMAAGLPVIASDVGGTADIIEPGRNGLIVPGGDGAALAQAIEHILGDPAHRAAMAAQSRQLAEQRFDLVKNASRTFGYLRQIADARHYSSDAA